MTHYFTDNRNLKENRKDHSFRFSGYLYTFTTDNGVFSKTGIDQGSAILLESACSMNLSGRILDMGCGYGTLSVVLGHTFPDCSLTAVDVNPRAVELTELNAGQNGVELEETHLGNWKVVKNSINSTHVSVPGSSERPGTASPLRKLVQESLGACIDLL